jgi:acetaldehyde dehydrogenase (acetylating)
MEDLDLRSIGEARRLISRASSASAGLASLSQEAIDAVVEAIHDAAVPLAADWARLAVDETGFGNVAHKTAKNLFAAVDVYQFIRPMRTVGILSRDPRQRVIEIAVPAGVVAAIVPSTNPTSTTINKILMALKAACPIVVSPHPRAGACVQEVCRVLTEAALGAGAPEGAIGCMTEVALPGTRELMQHPGTGIILATGGTGLVRAAYSSGKPAYGVGPGNVPAYVDRTADVSKAARDIVNGKTFDHGVLCSAENAVVADAPVAEELRAAMEAEGCVFLDEAQASALSHLAVAPSGALNTAIVGRGAEVIADMAGLTVPRGTRCLVAPLTTVGADEPLSREKLSPILAFYVEDGWEAACGRCMEILGYGGVGHTLSIHARDRDLIMRFALTKPVFRIVVNSPAAMGAVGLTTGLEPSMTLGCGALGGNITSDNITPRHLVNVKRLAFETRPYDGRPAPLPEPPAESHPPSAPEPSGPSVEAAAPPELPSEPRLTLAPPTGEPPTSAGLRRRVESLLKEKGLLERKAATAPPAPSPAPKPARASPGVEASFVCEADVRLALQESRKITISGRTIVTPSARELGDSHRIFVEN